MATYIFVLAENICCIKLITEKYVCFLVGDTVDIVCSIDELLSTEPEIVSTNSVTTKGAEELGPKPNDETSNSGKTRNI